MSGVEREREKRANELYWGSELSVNQIADEMDVSKGMLYELIHPEPTGLACPVCAQEVVHANRTARDRAMLACSHCGWEGDEDEAELGVADASVVLPEGAEESASDDVALADEDFGRKRVIVGGALIGAAVGLAWVLWSRRR